MRIIKKIMKNPFCYYCEYRLLLKESIRLGICKDCREKVIELHKLGEKWDV